MPRIIMLVKWSKEQTNLGSPPCTQIIERPMRAESGRQSKAFWMMRVRHWRTRTVKCVCKERRHNKHDRKRTDLDNVGTSSLDFWHSTQQVNVPWSGYLKDAKLRFETKNKRDFNSIWNGNEGNIKIILQLFEFVIFKRTLPSMRKAGRWSPNSWSFRSRRRPNSRPETVPHSSGASRSRWTGETVLWK